jgi:hypothetical protein
VALYLLIDRYYKVNFGQVKRLPAAVGKEVLLTMLFLALLLVAGYFDRLLALRGTLFGVSLGLGMLAITCWQSGRLEPSLLFLTGEITGASLLPWAGIRDAEPITGPFWLVLVVGALLVHGLWEHLRFVRLMRAPWRQSHEIS